jgi:hypothetical protein
MFYESGDPRPHLVSLRTGKQYFYREGTGEDRLRALKELERDDTPAPAKEPEPIAVAPPQPRPFDHGASVRMQLDEIRLHEKRKS